MDGQYGADAAGRGYVIRWALDEDEAALVAPWVAMRVPHVDRFGPCQAAVVERNGETAAVVLFHDWNPSAQTMQLSMAADTPRWATRPVVAALFHYAFVTGGANKLWTAVPHDARRVIRFNEGIGLRREAVLRHQFGHKQHAVIFSMLANEWRKSHWAK